MRNILFITFTVVFALAITSCSKGEDFQLSQSVFIPDHKNPGLPEYSEWGYNSFGVYIDKENFISNNELLPIKIIVENDSCRMMFKGVYKSKETTLSFIFPKSTFPNDLPKDNFALLDLDGTSFDFKQEACLITIKREVEKEYRTDTLKIIKGKIEFKNVKKLLVDKEPSKTILSGKFNFQVYMDEEPTSFKNGRFDFGIDDSNFYNLD